VARQAGVKTKDVTARLGDPEAYPPVDEARNWIAARMSKRIEGFIWQAELEAGQRRKALEFERKEMTGRHRQERDALKDAHEKRWIAETKARTERLPRGFSGIWQRLTGKYTKIRQSNEHEAWQALLRDSAVPGHGFGTARCAGYAAILTPVAASGSRAFCSALI